MDDGKIFESAARVHASEDLMSFSGCPNKCRKGYYVDPYRHKRLRCEYCYDMRKQLVRNNIQVDTDTGINVQQMLRLPETHIGYGKLEVDALFVQSELNKIENWSVLLLKEVLNLLMERVTIGEPVVSSMLVSLGRRAHTQLFIAPFLIRSYLGGLVTAPYLTARDVLHLRLKSDNVLPRGLVSTYEGLDYNELIAADTCLIYIDSGSSAYKMFELDSVKGLMQLRAWQGKGTLILTDSYNYIYFRDNLESDIRLMPAYSAVSDNIQQAVKAARGLIDGTMQVTQDLAVFISVKYKNDAFTPYSYGVETPSPETNTQPDLLGRVGNIGVG